MSHKSQTICPQRILSEAQALIEILANLAGVDLTERIDNNLAELADLSRKLPNKL